MVDTSPPAPTRLRSVRRAASRIPGMGLVQAVPKTMTFMVGSQLRGRRAPLDSDRPGARPSWQMVGQVAMDEAILGLVAASRLPHRDDYSRVSSEVLEAHRMWSERGWMDDPASYHETPPRLDEVKFRTRRSRGVSFEQLSFDSGYVPHPGEPGRDRWTARIANRTGHAWVLRHPGPERPWMVCIHGMGMGNPLSDFPAFKAARLHHERGLNLVFPVLPMHGPRRAERGDPGGFPGYDQLDAVHGFAQALWDIRRLVGWVQDQGAPAIGAHGISLGGYAAALVSTYEPRITSVIAGVPVVDLPRLNYHHANGQQRKRGLEYHLAGEVVERVHRVVSPLARPPLLDPARLAVYGGIGDRMATPAQAHLLWNHWGKPEICWYPGNHVGFFWSSKVDRFVTDTLDRFGLGEAQDRLAAQDGESLA